LTIIKTGQSPCPDYHSKMMRCSRVGYGSGSIVIGRVRHAGLLNVCGIQTEDAPGVLSAYFATLSDRRVGAADRIALYQGLVAYLQMCAIEREGNEMRQSPPLELVKSDAFEILAWDMKAALFLIAALDFGLRDTAQILQTAPGQLMAGLDAALTNLASPRRSNQRPRRR
jgi:hypothetical protein